MHKRRCIWFAHRILIPNQTCNSCIFGCKSEGMDKPCCFIMCWCNFYGRARARSCDQCNLLAYQYGNVLSYKFVHMFPVVANVRCNFTSMSSLFPVFEYQCIVKIEKKQPIAGTETMCISVAVSASMTRRVKSVISAWWMSTISVNRVSFYRAITLMAHLPQQRLNKSY